MEALTDGQRGTVITGQTPPHGTMGRPAGDVGVITSRGEFKVRTPSTSGRQGGSCGRDDHGMLPNGNTVTCPSAPETAR